MGHHDRIMQRLWVSAILAAGLVLSLVSAAAASAPASQYRLLHPAREHCRAHYARQSRTIHRRVHGRRVTVHRTLCVRVKPATPPVSRPPASPSKPVLHAGLDPSFTQSAANPLAVTYAYSASAIETVGGGSRPAPLPPGILNLYSDGSLVCSINVGGTATSGSCPVNYSAFGSHTVIVDYVSGEASATETDTEQIEPYSTTTALSVQPLGECTTGAKELHSCSYLAEVKTLDQNGNAPPFDPPIYEKARLSMLFSVPNIIPQGIEAPDNSPFAITLARVHEEAGWVCSLSYGDQTWALGGTMPGAQYQPEECTVASVQVSFKEEQALFNNYEWLPSESTLVSIHF
jgi:hypothetical protein